MPFLFEPILKEIIEYFQNNEEAQRRVLLLVKKDRQAEAWFKAELMNIFEQSEFVCEYHPEVTYLRDNEGDNDPRIKCDFVIDRKLRNNRHILIGVEGKTAFVGYQKKRLFGNLDPDNGQRFNLFSYVGHPGDKPSGVAGDAYRLVNFTNEYLKERICLLFVYGKKKEICLYKRTKGQLNDRLNEFYDRVQNEMPAGRTVEPIGDPFVVELNENNEENGDGFKDAILVILAYEVS